MLSIPQVSDAANWLKARPRSTAVFVLLTLPTATASYFYLIEKVRETSVVSIIAEQHTLLLILSLIGIQLPWLPIMYWVSRGRTGIRDMYKYKMMVGDHIMHYGITKNLKRIEDTVRSDFRQARAVQIGRRTTRKAAERWLYQQNTYQEPPP